MRIGRIWVIVGGIFGLIGVGMGAFGAHALTKVLEANGRQAVYETAVQYQFVHALAILFLSTIVNRRPGRLNRAVGILFSIGIIFFSGSLYLLAILNIPIMGAVAPIGGVAFLLGWLCLILAAWRDQSA